MYIKLIPVLNQAEPVNRMFLLCITLGTSVAASSRHRELRQLIINATFDLALKAVNDTSIIDGDLQGDTA
ncbi:uncharacterized protein PHALS_14650 [Plasmopara halstedii]|uniref:Uncharacterized protein n=1 Tax=Plasmopara halstedii TaxID=4781 RepID=A0A0P1ANF8_PLAHL|nr:uncharacterized protein PHALS_14650 [Plasmopara halstedii]CEG42703.1 hypothetical protein PHALS_14650 [Plasmopara halstedii]|eukprot:XP_024579072.1 hypothetical protein PHALS_14650 [Plasmopara halstedii]